MILTVASSKGGGGKTTTAVCLAAVLSEWAPTILFDDDDNTRSARRWTERSERNGRGFPFATKPGHAMVAPWPEFTHRVVDSGQGPTIEDLEMAAKFSTLLILPTPPDGLDSDTLLLTIEALQEIGASNYRVLITRAEYNDAKDVIGMREGLHEIGAPVFDTIIPELKAFRKAGVLGGLVRDVKNDENAARAWQSYVALGEELRPWL